MEKASRIGTQYGRFVDVSVDASGKHLLCGAENGDVLIFDASVSPAEILNHFPGVHTASVMRVSWANPRSGPQVGLSLGDDKQLILWKEQGSKLFSKSNSHTFKNSVFAAAFAPCEYNLKIACALDSGKVAIISPDSSFGITEFEAYAVGSCHAVSWCPGTPPGLLLALPPTIGGQQQQQQLVALPRVATVGGEGTVKIFRFATQDNHWMQEHEFTELKGLILRDVAWAPNYGVPFTYIAVCADEGQVSVWLQDGLEGRWKHTTVPVSSSEPALRVSWSLIGTFLAVCSENGSTIWKEQSRGDWALCSSIVVPEH